MVLFRVCYVALKTGLPIEFFKLSGTVVAVYLSSHYYTTLSALAVKHLIKGKQFLGGIFDFILFIILAAIGYGVFIILRMLFYRFIKMEATPKLNKFGGLVLGIARGILLASLLMFILVVSGLDYFKVSIGGSYLGRRIFKVVPETYSRLWNDLVSKIMINERLNDRVFTVQRDVSP
ncbi:MAG: CvpA family protein [Candidatus Omnitrophica bacterium]|nr:CvpA family protein [Candidatus Omnitrophota bacterium]